MRGLLIPILVLGISLAGVRASAAGEEEGNGKRPEPGTTVEMPFLIAPMSDNGKLLGYAYISSKMVCSSGAAAILVRQKLGFIQDRFVRDVNGKAISLSQDPKTVDKPALNARLTADARSIVGANKIVSMLFVDIKFNPLRPSQSTGDGQVPPDNAAPQKPAGEADKPKEGEGAGAKTSKDDVVAGESAQKSRPK